jgi:uncharacterized membrane protein
MTLKQEHIPLVTALCGFACGIILSAFWAVPMAQKVIVFLCGTAIALAVMYVAHADSKMKHTGFWWKDVLTSLWLLFIAIVVAFGIVGSYLGCFYPGVSLAMLLGY